MRYGLVGRRWERVSLSLKMNYHTFTTDSLPNILLFLLQDRDKNYLDIVQRLGRVVAVVRSGRPGKLPICIWYLKRRLES
jgi:hypothetical protein